MTKIAIIDYGSGNVRSVHKAFAKVSNGLDTAYEVMLTNDLNHIQTASHLVLPGVGAYADCARGIKQVNGLWELIHTRVSADKIPFMGICVGMQLMSLEGREYETTAGFGWIDGIVEAIRPDDPDLKIPHMGWNTLTIKTNHPVLNGITTGQQGQHAYFVHSYHMNVKDKKAIIATAEYGGEVTAMIAKDNMIGTQFHPEKSQELGLTLIENFITWRP